MLFGSPCQVLIFTACDKVAKAQGGPIGRSFAVGCYQAVLETDFLHGALQH